MRVALIGVGHWHAAMHLRSLQLAADAEIVGVSDSQAGVAATFAETSGGQAFSDYHEMLETTRPDFVLAMGRPVDMPTIGRDLIAAAIPCALEKPVGISAADIADLVELARSSNAFVAVPFTNRYSALWSQLEQLEQDERLGTRSNANFRIVNGPPDRYEADGVGWMLDPVISGGGCMRNLGIHTADAFLHFTGGEAVEVLSAAITHRIYDRGVEEMGVALLRSESGVIGTIEAGYTFASMTSGDFEARIAAANCTLIDRGDTLQIATLDDGQVQQVAIPNQGARYDRFCVDTLERLRDGRPPIATLEDCYRAMQIIDDIYAIADS
jgi:predicted dehydrogenase